MTTSQKKQEILIEPYLSMINKLRKEISFSFFENTKPYSFDYHLKNKFQSIEKKIKAIQEANPNTILSPSVKKSYSNFSSFCASTYFFF